MYLLELLLVLREVRGHLGEGLRRVIVRHGDRAVTRGARGAR